MIKRVLLIILLLGVYLYFLLHLQFTAWPEMFSYPYLRNHGFLLYKDMIHPYPPLLTMILSVLYSLFGYKLQILEYFTWGLLLVNSVLVYVIARSFVKKEFLSFLAMGLYIFLQPFFEGNMMWFDIAIVTPILLAFYYLNKALTTKNNRHFFLTGIFLCIAILIKQTVGLYLIFLCFYFFWQKVSFKKWIYFLLPFPLLGVPLLIRLLQEKALQDFINWTLVYPLTYWSKFPGYVQMQLSKADFIVLNFLFLPLLILLTKPRLLLLKNTQLLLIFLICSLVGIYPRFSFFHFQTALVFLVLTWIYLLDNQNKKIFYLGLGVILLAIAYLVHLKILRFEWDKEASFYTNQDLVLAIQISKVGQPSDEIYLFGVQSGLYTMSTRLPPKRWTDNYVWYLEIPGVQEEILSRWKQNPPQYVLWQMPRPGNWYDLATYQPQKIVQYIKSDYNFDSEIRSGIDLWRHK